MPRIAIVVLAALWLALGAGVGKAADSSADLPDGFYLVLDNPDDLTADAAVITNEDQPDSPVTVARKALVLAKEIARAWASEDRQTGGSMINIEMTPAGGTQLRDATTRYLGHRMAIVVGGVVLSAPMIVSPVGAKTQIQGNFDTAQAKAIVERLTPH
jgi:preprotein translocase subunit SecD